MKIAKSQKRGSLPECVKIKISEAQKGEKSKHFGVKQTEEHRLNVINSTKHTYKKILQYNLAGEFIQEYKSASSAARHTDSEVSHIIKCIKGKRKTHNKYIWKEKK